MEKMLKMTFYFALIPLLLTGCVNAKNNFNCPAPRSPDNGLSFIFRNGEKVEFRCHPGYQMIGNSVIHCVNNEWTAPSPDCYHIGPPYPYAQNQFTPDPTLHISFQNRRAEARHRADRRQLFNWGERDASTVYGDGPKRLPLINGIWPPHNYADQVLALGPQSTPGPRELVKEEIDIAELRNKQLEELKRIRYNAFEGPVRRKHGRRKNKNKRKHQHHSTTEVSVPRETVLSLGSTADGQALSVAQAKPLNETTPHRHAHRHHHGESLRAKDLRNTISKYDPAGYFNNIVYSRKSRVNTGRIPYWSPPLNNDVAEFRRMPVEQVQPTQRRPQVNRRRRPPVDPVEPPPRIRQTSETFAAFDASCVESLFRRSVPKIAPEVHNGFVYRYETKLNKLYPFNVYMAVRYRCFNGHAFATEHQSLHCREGSWVGPIPICMEASAVVKE